MHPILERAVLTSLMNGAQPSRPSRKPQPLSGLQNTMLAQQTADELAVESKPVTERDERRSMLARFRAMFGPAFKAKLRPHRVAEAPRRMCATPEVDE